MTLFLPTPCCAPSPPPPFPHWSPPALFAIHWLRQLSTARGRSQRSVPRCLATPRLGSRWAPPGHPVPGTWAGLSQGVGGAAALPAFTPKMSFVTAHLLQPVPREPRVSHSPGVPAQGWGHDAAATMLLPCSALQSKTLLDMRPTKEKHLNVRWVFLK